MDKRSFDVAMIPGMREKLREAYVDFRKAHISSDSVLLDEDGAFLPDISYSRACPLCGTENAKFLFFTRGMHIVTCASCSITYSREVLTKAADRSMYEQSQFMAQYDAIKNNPIYSQLETAKSNYIMEVVGRFAENSAKLLDIGSSNGQIMLSAIRHGWVAHGIEANSDLAKQSIAAGLNVAHGFFPDDMPSGLHDFDLVTILDVLEHTEQPLAFLKKVGNHLKVGGLALVQVPNFDSLILRLEGADNSNFCHGHWSHFNANTLDRTMETAGFKKLFSETIISELDRILQFDAVLIEAALAEITGVSPDNNWLQDLTPDFLHRKFLGYKLFCIYRKV